MITATINTIPFEMFTGCFSTHGGMGYSIGDYWDGDAIVCGSCGYRIENPHPTGSDSVPITRQESFWRWLKGEHREIPHWPDFIRGQRGVKWQGDPPPRACIVIGE